MCCCNCAAMRCQHFWEVERRRHRPHGLARGLEPMYGESGRRGAACCLFKPDEPFPERWTCTGIGTPKRGGMYAEWQMMGGRPWPGYRGGSPPLTVLLVGAPTSDGRLRCVDRRAGDIGSGVRLALLDQRQRGVLDHV